MRRPKRYPGLEHRARRAAAQRDEQRAARIAGGVVLGVLATMVLVPLVAVAVGWLR